MSVDSVCKRCAEKRCESCFSTDGFFDANCKICMHQECPFCYSDGKGGYVNKILFGADGNIKQAKNWTLLVLFSFLLLVAIILFVRKMLKKM